MNKECNREYFSVFYLVKACSLSVVFLAYFYLGFVSKSLAAESSYDIEMTMCKFVVKNDNPEDVKFNNISPADAAQFYFHNRGTELVQYVDPRLSSGSKQGEIKVKLIEGPGHGKLVKYIYHSDATYDKSSISSDKMVFSVTANKTRFKVNFIVYVVPQAPDLMSQAEAFYPDLFNACPDGYHIYENQA